MLENFRTREFTKDEARRLNPLQLALIGDAVYEVFIRGYVIANNTELSAHKIHREAINYVKAKGQSDIMHNIEDLLNEEESYIFKRGRNAKVSSVPKNAEVADYHAATGLEALFGYLYLKGEMERLKDLLYFCVKEV